MSSILSKLINLAGNITGTLGVANGGTGVTSSTGTGSIVLSTSPTLITPALGTPASGTLTNCTGYPVVVPGTSNGLVSANGVPCNTTGSAITSGYIGETLTSNRVQSSGRSLTTNSPVNVTSPASITLTTGIWVISGAVGVALASGTTLTQIMAAISKTTDTIPSSDTVAAPASGEYTSILDMASSALTGQRAPTVSIPPYVFVATTSTTLYLVVQATFGTSTAACFGFFQAVHIA